MTEQLKMVQEFHETFRQQFNTSPTLLSFPDAVLRYKLGQEELLEYLEANNEDNLVEILDSLADQLYILLGTTLKHGLQDKLLDAFALVHENNMKKLDANGQPILRADGKILKPEGFVPVKLDILFPKA